MMEDWMECELKNLSIFELGGDWGKSTDTDIEGYSEAYCIRGAEFKNWQADKGKTASLRLLKDASIKKRNLQENDILVEISGGGPEQPVGRTEIIDKSVLNNFKGANLVCTNFLRLLRPNPIISAHYLLHYLKFFYSTGKIVKYQAGSNNLRNLKFNDFLSIKTPLPPLPIQRAIVAKIETLFSSLDSGIADLKKAQAQLRIYRQAVLKKAFEGELTAEWRAKQKDLPTAEALLAEIKAERERYYAQKMAEWKKAVKAWEENGKEGKKPGKPRALKEYPALKVDEIEDFEELPKPWVWGRINDAVKCLDYRRKPINKKERLGRIGDIPYYGANGQVGWIDDYLFDEELVLVVEDETFTGRQIPFAYKISGKSWVNNHAHVLRNENWIDIDYLNYSLWYYPFTALTTGTTGRKKLTQNALLNAPYKLIPLKEQHQIVQEIESRLSVCDKVEESISQSLEKAEALRQSILKKAFAGELLTAEEIAQCKKAVDYEPASVLLERIKTEQKQSKKK